MLSRVTSDKVWGATKYDFYLSIGQTIRFNDGDLKLYTRTPLEEHVNATEDPGQEYPAGNATVTSSISHLEGRDYVSLVDIDPILWEWCKDDAKCTGLCLRSDVSRSARVPWPASRTLMLQTCTVSMDSFTAYYVTCLCAQWASNTKCQSRLVELSNGLDELNDRRALESGRELLGRRLVRWRAAVSV